MAAKTRSVSDPVQSILPKQREPQHRKYHNDYAKPAEKRLGASMDTTGTQQTGTKAFPPFIRQRELMTILPFSPATLWRKVRNRTFVQPVKLSERITAWDRNQVLAWLEEKGGES